MCSDYYSRKICWKNQKFLSSIHKLLLYRISRACGHQPVLTCPVQVSTLPCPGRRVFLEICPVSCPEQGRLCPVLWTPLEYNKNNNNSFPLFSFSVTLFQIPKYEHLQILICNGNSLTTLAGIEHMKHLWKLDVGNNQVYEIDFISFFF